MNYNKTSEGTITTLAHEGTITTLAHEGRQKETKMDLRRQKG